MILCSMDKQSTILHFSRLIKMFGKKNWILLNARSNSFRYKLDAEHQTGEQYSKQGKINV